MEYPILNRKYIFKRSIFQPAMLVYRSVIKTNKHFFSNQATKGVNWSTNQPTDSNQRIRIPTDPSTFKVPFAEIIGHHHHKSDGDMWPWKPQKWGGSKVIYHPGQLYIGEVSIYIYMRFYECIYKYICKKD